MCTCASSPVPRRLGINYVGGEKGPGIHCFADVILQYDFPQNVRKALYVPRLLRGGTPKHSTALFIPEGLKGDIPGRLSQLLLLPFAEGNGLLVFICQNCRVKAEFGHQEQTAQAP